MKKKITTICLIVFISFIVLGDTNSFAGWADFSEEDAEKQEQEQIQEEPKYDETASKNNYLSSLSVDGYTLSPEFDKQVLNYKVKEQVKSKSINVKANAEDTNAKITGTGKITIDPSKEQTIEINVTAASGTVRTYKIIINPENKDEEDPTSEKSLENFEDAIQNEDNVNSTESTDDGTNRLEEEQSNQSLNSTEPANSNNKYEKPALIVRNCYCSYYNYCNLEKIKNKRMKS